MGQGPPPERRRQYTPKQTKRTALLRELKDVFRRFQSQPVEELIAEINPKLRGWVNYFRIGYASRSFAFVRQWVEKRVRRHLMGARNRRGFGWKRWSRPMNLRRPYMLRFSSFSLLIWPSVWPLLRSRPRRR
jgi:hypothetical protein